MGESRWRLLDGRDDRGAAGSFDRFFVDQFPVACRLAFLLIGDQQAAEDVGQESLINVGRRFETVDNPAAYLHTAVVNASRNWLCGNRRRQARERTVGEPGAVEIDPDTIEVVRRVAGLPFEQRAVVVLRYWLDLPDEQIADRLGCRPSTVRSRSARALARLREELS